MARKTTLNNGGDTANADDRPCVTARRIRSTQPPRVRLTGVRAMTVEEQRRFEALVESLLTHWAERSGDEKEGDHGRPKTEE